MCSVRLLVRLHTFLPVSPIVDFIFVCTFVFVMDVLLQPFRVLNAASLRWSIVIAVNSQRQEIIGETACHAELNMKRISYVLLTLDF